MKVISRNQAGRRAPGLKISVLLGGATDLGNNDNRVALVVWCETSASDERIHIRIANLGVKKPKNLTGIGLFDVLETSLRRLGI